MRDIKEIVADIEAIKAEKIEKEARDAEINAYIQNEIKTRSANGDDSVFSNLHEIFKCEFEEQKRIRCRLNTLKQLISRYAAFNVQVGDGVTVHGWSDCHAYTVIAKSKSGNKITLQRDKATLKEGWKPEFIAGGFAGHCVNQDEQEYDYERDENGSITYAYWSEKHGLFMVEKTERVFNGRHEFYDYNF